MGWAEKRGVTFRARWTDAGGAQRSASGFRTEADALDYAALRERFRIPDATIPPAEKQVVTGEHLRVLRCPDGSAVIGTPGKGPDISLKADWWNDLCEIIRQLDGAPRPAAPVVSRA